MEAPLNARGWVLQVRVLAQRVIHFGKDQLYFECHELDACETQSTRATKIKVVPMAATGRSLKWQF